AADPAAELERAFAAADAALHSGRSASAELATMATTLIAAVADTATVALAHVGDSRAYRLAGGALEQLTRDHTVAQQMVDDGVLKPEQRDRVPFANVLARAMDGGGRVPEVSRLEWAPGERLVLCSDGLNAALTGEGIMAALEAADPAIAVERLIEAANRADGPDNITVIVLELSEASAD
ncbi:serine/threonine-protein phosphatase, partial [Ectothiorhodospiraceae bacterium WFHF3C12]|nr:serine/threonine-protein phosphatase [Ectothiorhodospiraceae bacterium WFHF3C12]